MLEDWFKKWSYRQNIKTASVSNVSQCIKLTNHNAFYATTETVDADETGTPHDTEAVSLADEPHQKLELTIRILTQIETKQSFRTRHS